MTLIKSISGIRGTIGGPTGDTLNPLDIVKFTTAYATLMKRRATGEGRKKIVVGRDARISGDMVRNVVCGTLMGMGLDVIDIDLATTPTTELAVRWTGALGGIIITASHNPRQWNALKLLNSEGEFLTKDDGNEVLSIAEKEDFDYADVDSLGSYTRDDSFNQRHIESVLDLKLADVDAIRNAKFKVCVDAINSVGGIILPDLLKALGVEYTILNSTANGDFAHNPEPLEKNLQGIMDEMRSGKYNLGIVVDPDVDRLAFICENGEMFGEEYTLVSVADYVLQHTPGNTVSNLSSTRALRDVTERHRSRRGERYDKDERGRSRYRRRRQWWRNLPGEPLRSRRPCRHRSVPLFIGSQEVHSKRAPRHIPQLLHRKESHRPHSVYRHRRYPREGEGDVCIGEDYRHRWREDRLPRQVGTPAQVEHRAYHPRVQRGCNDGRG